MKKSILAERYGEAFLSYAKESVGFDAAVEELRNLKLFLHGNEGSLDFLKDLQFSEAERCDFIDKVMSGNFSEEVRTFLKFLVEKDRINLIDEICDYVRTTYSAGEAVEVVLKTAYPLDTDMIEKIKDKLSEKIGRKINLFIRFEPELLGGVQVVIGNTIIDGSIKNRLYELRRKLMAAKIS